MRASFEGVTLRDVLRRAPLPVREARDTQSIPGPRARGRGLANDAELTATESASPNANPLNRPPGQARSNAILDSYFGVFTVVSVATPNFR